MATKHAPRPASSADEAFDDSPFIDATPAPIQEAPAPRPIPKPARKMRFSEETIAEIKPEGHQYYVWDTRHKGFGVRVGVSGHIAFVVKLNLPGGRSTWKTLESSDLSAAVVEYHELMAKFGRGESLPKRQTVALWQDAVDRFWTFHKPTLKETTAATYASALKHVREAFMNRPVRMLTFEDVRTFHASMANRPRQANICIKLSKLIFDRSEAWGLRDLNTNPVDLLKRSGWKPYREEHRDVRLSDEQLWKIGQALALMESSGEESPYPIAAVRLLLFTGLRLRSVLNLKWSQVDLENRHIVLKDHKTAGQVGTLLFPLNDPSLEVLQRLPRIEGNPYVLPGGKPGKPIDDIRKFWTRMLTHAELERVQKKTGESTTLHRHDLRHAHGNMAADLGMTLQTTASLLGHANVSSASRYSKSGEDATLKASQKVAQSLQSKLRKGRDKA